MTREEEINQASMMYVSAAHDPYRSVIESFKAGAHWSDIHPKTSQWISIEKQLPPVGKLVLWRGYRETFVAYRDERNHIIYKGGYFGTIHSLELDSWTPIPE